MSLSQIDILKTMDHLMILCDDCHCMTKWEYDFIDEMEGKRIDDRSFTVPELNKINTIFKERME